MNTLSKDWLTEGLMDYEYKKYVLLAYLKDIRAKFNHTELYPFFSELLFHFRNLKRISENKDLLIEQFPKQLTGADFEKLELNYRLIIEDDEVMKVMQEIIAFALPRMTHILEEGKELHDFISEQIEFDVVGITPVYDLEGYLLINIDAARDVYVYRYNVTLFENAADRYRGVNTTFVQNDYQDTGRTVECIKLELAKSFQELPNPNTFLVVSKMKFPLEPTILPVAKQLVMRSVNVA